MRSRYSGQALIAALISAIFSTAAEAQQSDSMSACHGHGRVTIDQRIAACSSIIEDAATAKENLALAYGNRGAAKAHKKLLESARTDYEESLRLDSSSAASHRFRGNLYLLDRDERRAPGEFRKSIEIDPKHGPAYLNLGIMALRRGSSANALMYLNRALEFEPDNPVAHLVRGQVRIQLDAYDDAIADFSAALNGSELPEPAEAFFGRGSAFAHRGEHQKALADYDEGLRLRSDRGDPFATRCAIRAALGQPFHEAIKDCEQAIRLGGNPIFVQNMRGYALLRLGKPDRAHKEFDNVLSVRPGPFGEAQAMALYGRGLAKLQMGDTPDAAKDIDLAIKTSPRIKQRATAFFGLKD
jgi:tetratricopeptide (TPR) repeat protein